MSRVAYLDCFSGVAGDMFLAAAIDAGASAAWLRTAIARVVPHFTLTAKKDRVHGLGGTRVTVRSRETGRHHRGLPEIQKLILKSGLPPRVKERSLAVFTRLAQAEAKVHRVDLAAVHFHEVGAIDALVDVVGVVLALDRLGIDELVVSPLPMGMGKIVCAHGVIPSPAPATLELVIGAPVRGVNLAAELVTPTGAALVTTLASSFGPMPPMVLTAVGVGLGRQDLGERPNLARLLIGERIGAAETAVQIEAAIDDMPAERFDHLMDRLHAAGALEVMFIPAQMKKNRPGVLVRVLARPEDSSPVMAELFNHSSTLGARAHEVFRQTLERQTVTVDLPFGQIRIKLATRPDGATRRHPEYDDLKRAARKSGKSIDEIERLALDKLRKTETP